jgi:beta-lactam-binding protein with PASTA domain
VIGMRENQAVRQLERQGFNVAVERREVESNEDIDGRVIDQNPDGGSAPRGSTVTIVVAVQEPVVVDPCESDDPPDECEGNGGGPGGGNAPGPPGGDD